MLHNTIKNLIYVVRGQQVMLAGDLAFLYQVETRALNQAVKRNIARFPENFRFQLTEEEYINLKSQFVISSLEDENIHGGRRYLPYVFTEQGIAMLSAVLRSDVAIQVSIKKKIVLIDNYVDVDTLNILAKKKSDVDVIIYTLKKAKLSQKDINNFNQQYPVLEVFHTNRFHDRFLIVDDVYAYHIGASIKDAGKKCFGINKIEDKDIVKDILERLRLETEEA